MTLALILLFGLTSVAPDLPPSLTPQDTPQAPATQPSTPQNSQSSPAPGTPTSSPTGTQASKPSASKPRHKRRTVKNPNCDPTPPASSDATAGTSDAQAAKGTASSGTASAQKNCPATKTVIRNGGATAPSIQIVGDQPPSRKDETNRLLSSTDENLKKLAGRELNANQQNMVKQVHQFMDQSRSALQSGDTEHAKTLAWKAQQLSQELVGPSK